MSKAPQPNTNFDWAIYADATFAGLSVLIPFVGLDWAFESFFRYRMPLTIAKRRQKKLPPGVQRELNKSDAGCMQSCMTLPFKTVLVLLKKLSRKILYFLTIKEAADQLNYYWHQAFLIDYMLVEGHLVDEESAMIARHAMRHVLEETDTSPLNQLAGQVIAGSRHVLGSLRRVRRQDEEDAMLREKKSLMAQYWVEFSEYFEELAHFYHQSYDQTYVAYREELRMMNNE